MGEREQYSEVDSNHYTFLIRSSTLKTGNKYILSLEFTLNSGVHALRKILDIATIQSCHRDPAIHRKVYVRLLCQGLALLWLEARES